MLLVLFGWLYWGCCPATSSFVMRGRYSCSTTSVELLWGGCCPCCLINMMMLIIWGYGLLATAGCPTAVARGSHHNYTTATLRSCNSCGYFLDVTDALDSLMWQNFLTHQRAWMLLRGGRVLIVVIRVGVALRWVTALPTDLMHGGLLARHDWDALRGFEPSDQIRNIRCISWDVTASILLKKDDEN